MEVVCLILGPMLASQPRSHAFWVLMSLHLLSFLMKMFFIILYIYIITGAHNDESIRVGAVNDHAFN